MGTAHNKWAGLGVLAAGLSMIVIDGTILGVSLPTIIADLHLDLNEAQWVNSLDQAPIVRRSALVWSESSGGVLTARQNPGVTFGP
ncbi:MULTISPECIES: hypothetical protein [Arthrobacter]|uniref:hypothetical protein n=1 Tax=unclassified Arthrobacter TaxID=235627 RepID=UPI0024BAE703|nr:hypothetical protein [Arthrobacter sp. H35-MC1]MDJ0316810.1 hypothetical protein [Arthrobacter sp. H35-MC1]